MSSNFLDFLSSIKDPRRPQGVRHSLVALFSITFMAILSRQHSLRGIARFAKNNKEELVASLQLSHGVPGFNTFRDFFQSIDLQSVSSAFILWLQSQDFAATDDFIALDGKAVKSTVSGGNTAFQNFVAVVSAFGHRSGMVYGMESYENGKSAETQCVRELIEKLGLVDKVLTMDALHAKKNF